MSNHFNCIYMYINKVNGKRYVGKAKDFNERHKQHLEGRLLIDKKLREYGEENFETVILAEDVDDNRINDYEKFFIKRKKSHVSYGTGYNRTWGGDGGDIRSGMTEEQRKEHSRKVSEAKKDKPLSEEHKQKISEANKQYVQQEDYVNSFKGKHHTDEWKQQHSEKVKGRKHTEEELKKMCNSQKQRWQNITDEERVKFGRKVSERQTGEKNPMYGKHCTEEHKRKIKENHPNRKKVYQYDLDGNYIQTFDSITDAQRAIGIKSGVRLCCQGKIKQAGGYTWKFEEENIKEGEVI